MDKQIYKYIKISLSYMVIDDVSSATICSWTNTF